MLQNDAEAFENLTHNDYIFKLGNNKHQMCISIISNDIENFNHIFGLDHLTDIPEVTAKSVRQKVAIYNKIQSGE